MFGGFFGNPFQYGLQQQMAQQQYMQGGLYEESLRRASYNQGHLYEEKLRAYIQQQEEMFKSHSERSCKDPNVIDAEFEVIKDEPLMLECNNGEKSDGR